MSKVKLKYNLYPDEAMLLGLAENSTKETKIVIPEKVYERPVTKIQSHAFHGCDNIEKIEIPNSVTTIYNYAFAHCPNLTEINLPTGLKDIGIGAFVGCKKLKNIEIPNQVDCIPEHTFIGCTQLTNINIGSETASINIKAFDNCPNLVNITVAKNNPIYKDIDGILYTKDGKTLIFYPRGRKEIKYMLPENVTCINEHAVGENIKHIIISPLFDKSEISIPVDICPKKLSVNRPIDINLY